MKTKACAAIVVAMISCNLAPGGDGGKPSMRVRPIQIISCDNLPSEMAIDAKPMGYQPGFQVFYLVEGQDIAGFDSLAIESINTPEGVDIWKYRNGKPAYKVGVRAERTPCRNRRRGRLG